KLGAFDADDERILFRPGLIDFSALAGQVDRIGAFYAGSDPRPGDAQRWESFFSACAAPGPARTWRQVARLPAGDTTCGALFASMVADHRERSRGGNHTSRLGEGVGHRL